MTRLSETHTMSHGRLNEGSFGSLHQNFIEQKLHVLSMKINILHQCML